MKKKYKQEILPFEQVDEIDELLGSGLRIRTSFEFVKFFDFISKFNHYSRYNTMLVYIQNPAVTFFGTAYYWRKKFNRRIMPDAKPHIILKPKGPVALAFDILETTGDISAERLLERGLGYDPNSVNGKVRTLIYKGTITEVQNWGVSVIFKPHSYFKGGHITTIISGKLEICLKEGVSDERNFSVLLHELGHLLLGHTGHTILKHKDKNKTIKITTRKLDRSTEELEAETIKFLICKKLGLETRSAEYIAGYIKSEEDLKKFNYDMVIRTVDKIERDFLFKTDEIDALWEQLINMK